METETRDPFVSRQRVHFDMLDLLGILHSAAYLRKASLAEALLR